MSISAFQIREHMAVVGSDGGHVGTVDRIEGERIKLTREDDPDGSKQHHHFLPLSAVMSVQDGKVRLNVVARQAKAMAVSGGASESGSSLGATTEKLASKVQDAAGQAFDAARSRVEGAARQASDWADDAYGQASTVARDLTGTVNRTVEEQPMVALLVAGAIGFSLGLLIGSMRR